MQHGEERPADDAPDVGHEEAGDAPAKDDESQPRIPPEDARAIERGKRFIVGADAPLAVSVADGNVGRDYAPGDLIARVAGKVTTLLEEMGGGLTPAFYGAGALESMTLFFGDPRPEEAQEQLPLEHVLPQARRVAELIDQDDDDHLYRRALEVGPPAERYTELVHLVENESITLKWEVRSERVRTLTAARAHRQYKRLSQEVPTIDRPLTINGVLYRVIAEPRENHLGTVGIRLHGWSAIPPGYSKGAKVIAAYENAEIEEAINGGLLNRPVEAHLLIRTPVPGTSFDPKRRTLILHALALGPAERDHFGTPFDEIDEAD